MNEVVQFIGMGHINIVVDNIEEGIEFYKKLLHAVPYQIFRDFSNVGFSKAAGFLCDPHNIKLHIAFLEIPHTGLTIELMQYLNPETQNCVIRNVVSDIAGVRHVALKVKNIEEAFRYISSVDGSVMINNSNEYAPYKINNIDISEFNFFDDKLENNILEKQNVAETIGRTRYFYFLDKYGVQWEFEQGHTDVGNDK